MLNRLKLWPRRRILLVACSLLALMTTGTLFVLARHLTGLVEAVLRKSVGPELSLGSITAGWNRVVLKDIRIRRNGPGPLNERLRIERVVVTPSFRALFSRRLEIGLLRLERPMALIEIGPDGKLISPLPLVADKNKALASRPAEPPLSLRIDRIELENGELVVLDRHARHRTTAGLSNPREGYHLLRFPKLMVRADDLQYPLSTAQMRVKLALAAPEKGTLTIDGTMALANLDTRLTLSLRQWDLTRFRPYYQKQGDLPVTHGLLDGDATITIAKHRLNVPGEIRLKGLQLDLSGGRGLFLGMPATAVLGFLKNNKDEINVPFTLTGDLSNPRFQVRQSLVDQIATGVAGKIGIPIVSDVAKGVIYLGGKGIEGIGKLFGK